MSFTEFIEKQRAKARVKAEEDQKIRDEVGGPAYAAERKASLKAFKEGNVLGAILHSFSSDLAALAGYTQEGPFTRLQRARAKQRAEQQAASQEGRGPSS